MNLDHYNDHVELTRRWATNPHATWRDRRAHRQALADRRRFLHPWLYTARAIAVGIVLGLSLDVAAVLIWKAAVG